jgi:hypothetical protein
MSITVTVESVQHNFYQLVRQLIAGDQDKVIATDAGVNLFQMVTKAVYDAADPGGAAGATEDIIASYSGMPSVYKAPLYRLVKRMRDRQAGTDAQKATGRIVVPAGGGGSILDTETFVLTNVSGTATTFEFDSGGGITGDVAVTFTGGEAQGAMATLIAGAITGAAINITALADATGVDVTQGDPGTAGNVAVTETVADAGFVVSGFAGGTDAGATASGGGIITLKQSKNDTDPVIVMVPEDHAVSIGL